LLFAPNQLGCEGGECADQMIRTHFQLATEGESRRMIVDLTQEVSSKRSRLEAKKAVDTSTGISPPGPCRMMRDT